MCVGKGPVSAADVVEDHLRLLFQQRPARVFFVLDELREDFIEPLDNIGFGLAKSHLIGNLKHIAERLGAFAVKPAHGQAQFVDRLNDLVDLLGQHQGRQVEHRAHTDARAEVGRAGSQVTEVGREGVIEPFLERGVHLVNRQPGGAELQARPQRLHAQMVFLVDHHAERFLFVQHQPAADIFGGVLAADQMALDQNLLVHRGQVVHRLGERAVHLRQAFHRWPDHLQGLDAIGLLGPAGKRKCLEVARQADPARHHDADVRPLAFAGQGRRRQKFMDAFHRSSPLQPVVWPSNFSRACLISSRKTAACSKSSSATAFSSSCCNLPSFSA